MSAGAPRDGGRTTVPFQPVAACCPTRHGFQHLLAHPGHARFRLHRAMAQFIESCIGSRTTIEQHADRLVDDTQISDRALEGFRRSYRQLQVPV